MKGTYRKKDRRSSHRRRVYRAEVVQPGPDGRERSVRIDLPIGELLGDLRATVNEFAGEAGLRLMLTLIAGRLKAAWNMKDYATAKRELEALVAELAELNPSAAASLDEGLEETLTLHRLGVPEALRVNLRSTNPIERCFSTTRQTAGHVKRWRNSDQAWRWAGSSLADAEK